MSDLRQLVAELSDRKMTRKQFLALVGGSFLGMMGFFRFLQEVSTPDDLSTSDRGVFGEKEYGHIDSVPNKKQRFDQDVFG
jgi:hypothetical protein